MRVALGGILFRFLPGSFRSGSFFWRREIDARAARLGKSDGDGLFGVGCAVFPFLDVVDLFADKLARLGGRRLAFFLVLLCAFQSLFFRHTTSGSDSQQSGFHEPQRQGIDEPPDVILVGMRTRILTGLVLAVCFSPKCFAQGPAAVACVQDLETIPGFLLENDTGARDHLAQFGQKYFDDALAEAKSAALQIRGNASCAPVISKYLRAWRRGHLSVEDITTAPVVAAPEQSAADTAAAHLKSAPAIEVLSARTLRLTLKNFEP